MGVTQFCQKMAANSDQETDGRLAPRFEGAGARSRILKIARIVAWSLAAAIIVLSVIPAELRPDVGVSHYLEHLIIYFLTGLVFSLGYHRRRVLLGWILVIFSGGVELLQLFAPGRHARLNDFIIDALAMCLGVLAVSFLSGIRAENLTVRIR